VPEYPVVFTKPADALTGSDEDIPICPGAQPLLDFEGELTFVVSRDCKDLPLDFPLSEYILGYTAGNDVSARNYQLPTAGGGQFCYAKSFDKFAPIGPWIVSSSVIQDPQTLYYQTRVNGVEKQETPTSDMIWSVRDILHHLSRGTTVRAGTVVMTGTPSGVGYFRNEFLKDGDVVEVEITDVVKLSNTMLFVKTS
jgi:2-keto-4-pentenoate hydratase/2-oxohepta-3-ene-1,7-dioic acid hydratase in catechol pathway